MNLLPEFLEGAHLREDEPGFCGCVLQLVGFPLQNRVIEGFDADTASQEAERPGSNLGVDIQGDNMSSIARLAEEWQFEEWIHGVSQGRRAAIDRLPFPVVEPGEAPERLADIHCDILSLTSPVSP